MRPLDNQDLISTLKKMANGDEDAFRHFYTEHYNSFIKFGHLLTNDTQMIEDAVQNILIWFIENPRKLNKINRPDIYLFQSMRNNILKEVKKSKNKSEKIDLQDSVMELLSTGSAENKWVEQEELFVQNQRLQKEIEQLPDYLKQTLYLRYFSNLSYDEISKIMNIQTSVARIYIHRAVERLRKTIQKLEVILWLICFTEL